MTKKSYKRFKDYKKLIALADTALAAKGEGFKKLSRNNTPDLFAAISEDGVYSDAEKAAAAHIREEYVFTDAGRAVFAELLRDWALERGRATQAANRAAAAEEEAKKSAEEAKAEAKKAKEAAKAEAKKAKDEKTVRTTKIGDEELDYNLVKYALKCVEANLTIARSELSDEEYEKGNVGGRKSITKEDVDGLVAIVFEDGVYSDLEKDTMSWIRSNIGMTKGAREEWSKQMAKAKRESAK